MSKLKILIEEKHKIIVCLFFAVYLSVGVSIFKDYGISWDEPISRHLGGYTALYVLNIDQSLLTDTERHYGPVFEVLLVAIEGFLNLTEDPRAVFLMRHLVTFLLFYTGVFFFYLLCKDTFHSWKIGLLGSLFLILSPRIFAHSFYNSKDIAVLAMFIISIYTLSRFLDKKTLSRAAVHALTCALLIDIRILGIVVPFLTVVFLIGDLLMIETKGKKIIKSFLVYTFLLISFTILFWPFLWTDPLQRFIGAFKEMAHFPLKGTSLYLGDYIRHSDVPWHYVPVWIIISTPVFYTFCFFIGFFVSIKPFFMNPIKTYVNKRNALIFILWFFLPLVVVIVIKSSLYDAWRHMFFVYPAFLMISLAGVTSLSESIKIRFQGLSYKAINATFILFVAFNLICIAQIIVKYHPYQNVYFNILAGRNMEEIKNNFELDYWGLSYRKALEYILKNDTDKVIKIYVASQPGKENARILTAGDRSRLVYVKNPDEAKYFLSHYKWHKDEYLFGEEYYSIKIDKAKIMVVVKLPTDEAGYQKGTILKYLGDSVPKVPVH